MGVHDPLGRGQFGPQRLNWQDLCREPVKIVTYKIYKYISCGPHGFREEDFLSFSHNKSMGAIYRHGGHLDYNYHDHFYKFSIPL